MSRGHVGRIVLQRLSDRQVRALVGNIPGAAALAPGVLDHLVEQTDGVPLFAEELAKSVVEAAAEESLGDTPAIPASLQETLAARLERLGAVKLVGLVVSVLGVSTTTSTSWSRPSCCCAVA